LPLITFSGLVGVKETDASGSQVSVCETVTGRF
jgi:hypothetical protein